jgi:hypothetical protein
MPQPRPLADAGAEGFLLKHMKILKKSFAFAKGFDYISAPRQTEHV